jgi:hypothetical protein
MHYDADPAGQAASPLALAARALSTHGVQFCPAARAGWLPFIGTGTFLVAAYLGSKHCADTWPGEPQR